MSLGDSSTELIHPAQLSPAQYEAVVEEMNRVLADPGFNRSKRCVILFSHLVHCALQGDRSDFKERILGIKVFGRESDYNSQADPIVRMTASEIRKRLAQYYYDERHVQHPVKISLDRGTYVPVFDFGTSKTSVASPEGTQNAASLTSILSPAGFQRLGKAHTFAQFILAHKLIFGAVMVVLVATTAAALFHHNPAQSRQELFWDPLLHFDQPLMMCLTDIPSQKDTNSNDSVQQKTYSGVATDNPATPVLSDSMPDAPFMDASASNRISNWLGLHGRQIILHRASKLTLRMFRQGPAVLVGGFDSHWSLILLSHLRFSLHKDSSTQEMWIEDAQNPSKHDWKIKISPRFMDSFIDYAVITRYWDKETENWIAAVSSLGPHGSHAATDLIVEHAYENFLPDSITAKGNIQIVVKTSVINGTAGPPQIVAVYCW